ncbi:MAG: AAA family ATPase [Acidobacteriota bacterium]
MKRGIAVSARFTMLTLANWRNFKRVELYLGPRAFIVGPNASGKSNLLDAFRFLRDIAAPGGSLVNAVKDRRGLKHISSFHASRNSDVRIEVEVEIDENPSRWTYALEIARG